MEDSRGAGNGTGGGPVVGISPFASPLFGCHAAGASSRLRTMRGARFNASSAAEAERQTPAS
eukprot:scaffold21582_cov97-Isochrysis_galbana.AAC.4